jgi:hypothetical protein
MDLLTLLAYPIVFVYGKLRRLSKSKESITLAIMGFHFRQVADLHVS